MKESITYSRTRTEGACLIGRIGPIGRICRIAGPLARTSGAPIHA